MNQEKQVAAKPVVPPVVQQVLRSPGQPLDPATRKLMESRFRHDLAAVRVLLALESIHTIQQSAPSTNASPQGQPVRRRRAGLGIQRQEETRGEIQKLLESFQHQLAVTASVTSGAAPSVPPLGAAAAPGSPFIDFHPQAGDDTVMSMLSSEKGA
jgi:hypothetical protein